MKQGAGIPVTLGDLNSPSTLVAIVSIALTTALMALGFPGRSPGWDRPQHREWPSW